MSSPTLRGTSARTLVVTAVVAATIAWSVLRVVDGRSVDALTMSWLAVPWTLPLGLAVVAAGLSVSARAWSQRLGGATGARPVDPIAAARAVAAAKASALVGSAVAGLYAGYAVFLLGISDSELRTSRLWACLVTAGAAVAVVVAAMALERVLHLPDDEEPGGSTA